ncbi:(Fe-S)-binding protein [Brevibacillus sp. SYP-B805]|uniref:(Fe-S)-binding protein n=1 Tax=Brevibacillus sp. SYP-B805 TaxID=1578199 RepID=UPI0013EA98B1|nr:(Fe-S)-binding protein [Brevibacillus sp. SYP-B805]NGQ94963.1 (Fe-S)-binding protein [Brevibacillus sp. SYP-B805]
MSLPAATRETTGAQKLFDLAHDATNQCVQCGYCLPACPTYESMGREAASPRGRINLVKMAAEGKIDVLQDLAKPIDLCLGCRACEVACPVGVPYGHILEAAKEVIADAESVQPSAGRGSKLKQMVLSHLFPYPRRLRALGNLVWVYQKLGLDKLVRKTGLIRLLPQPMAAFEKVLPRLESPAKRTRRGTVIPAKGVKKASVAFFAGCVMDAMMHRTNRLSIELLSLVGCEVIIPAGQNCCGALHAHQGLADEARELAKANIEAFEQTGADFYVNNAGGCGAILREYDHLLAGEGEWAERADRFAAKSRDITEILVQYGPLPFQQEWEGVITYQDSCHLRNVQGVVTPPRQLLQSIPGATFVELEGSDSCCASGGIYNLLHFEHSMKILDAKMEKVKDTNAATIVTTNPGCLLQMKLGVERQEPAGEMRALHIVEVLAEACGIE